MRKTIFLILDTNSPPNVATSGREFQLRFQEISHAVRSLRQHLVGMPICFDHYACDILDVLVGHTRLEEVAHAVHEHESWETTIETARSVFPEPTVNRSLVSTDEPAPPGISQQMLQRSNACSPG